MIEAAPQPLPEPLYLRLARPGLLPTPATQPPDAGAIPDALCFGRFELQAPQRRLLADGEPVPLQARALDLLIALATRPGQLLSRQQLLDSVWPGLVVEENNVSVQVNALRKVLGAALIGTVPGRGYRFTALIDAGPARAAPGLAAGSAERSAAESLASPAPLAGPAVAPSTHLPELLPPLIGRDADLVALGALIDGHALVTLTGAGGMGKTRLAQALLHARRAHYPHGVCFVELGAVSQPGLVALVIAGAVGLRLSDGDDAAAALARTLAPLSMLIALDNAEHLLGPVAAVAQALLAGAPGIRLLITSQARLRLADERVYRLGALAVPPAPVGAGAPMSAAAALGYGAVALFVARAQALDTRFVLHDGNVADVIDLCRRLDGAALAIELAAGRLPLLGLPGLAAALGQRLRLLTQGQRSAPARQQTLRAALDWSHALLGPAERTVFRRMAVVEGSASLAMIQQVMADEDADAGADLDAGSSTRPALDTWAVLEALSALVDQSLVSVISSIADSAADPRYRLLDSPRALATEYLQAAGEGPRLRQRHARTVQELLDQACADLIEGRLGFEAFRDALAPDLDNAQAALKWALAHDSGQALAIAPVLSLAMGRNRHVERSTLWQAVEPLIDGPSTAPSIAAPAVTPAVLARACWQCADHWAPTRTQHALARARQAHALAAAAGDLRWAHLAVRTISTTSWRLGDLASLQAAVASTRSTGQAGWSAYVRAAGVSAEIWLCCLTDDQPGAFRGFSEQARLFRAAGIDDALTLNNIAGIHLAAGRSAEAITITRALVERSTGARDQYPLAISMVNLSAALLAEGRAAEARALAVESWPLARQFDLHPQWADDAALIAALEGRPEAALQLVGFADAAFAALGQPREAVDQIRTDRALQLARQALAASHGAAACDQLRADGALLSRDALPGLAFGPVLAPEAGGTATLI